MNIVLANALFPPNEHGGAENYVLRTTKALQKRGHEISVLTTKPFDGISSLTPNHTTYEGLDVWRFFPLNLSQRGQGTGDNLLAKAAWHVIDTANPHAPRAVGSLLDRLRPDVVHTNNLMGISTGIGRTIQRRGIRHVHTLHDYSLICPKSNLLRDFTAPDDELVVCEDPPVPCRAHAGGKRRFLGEPDVVTGPSQHVIDVHRQHGFFEDVPCQRLQLGVESTVDEPPKPPDDSALLYVGKQLRAKGLDTLFGAAAQLPDVTFHVCGAGPYETQTRRQAGQLPNLRYHGYVSDDELAQLRRESTAAVVPSIWMENSPLTIYESFAVGLPVIGSDIGGIPELVADGKRGYLFEPQDTEGLATAIEQVKDDDRTLRENALQWAKQRTVERHVDRLRADLYSK